MFLLLFSFNSTAHDINVLYISIDDLNNWVGYLEGHPQVKTPNIDRLAERGIAFTNAYCTTPLCVPSRHAILTGLSEVNTNVYRNGDVNDLEVDQVEFLPQYFAENNYTTYGTGKIHHKKINDKIFQFNFDTQQRWSPFSGSDEVDYTKVELPSKGTDNPLHVVENGPGGKTYVMPFNRMSSERSPNDSKAESFDWASFDLQDEEFGDGKITTWAIEQLKNHSNESPFFMAVGYYRPHIPLYAPKKYFDMYPLESIQLPITKIDDLDDIPQAGLKRALSATTAGTHKHITAHSQWKYAVQAYLACISFIDHQIGQLIDYLDQSPYAENTIIVLFSDHGWHLGEKQTWGKISHWTNSTSVPLIISPIDTTQGKLCHEPVSLLDLFPTLIEMAGLPEKKLDGISLVSLLNNPELETHRVVKTYVYKGNYVMTSRDWSYKYYENGDEELYNIQKDPMEFYNLIGAKEHQYLPKEKDCVTIIKELKENVQ